MDLVCQASPGTRARSPRQPRPQSAASPRKPSSRCSTAEPKATRPGAPQLGLRPAPTLRVRSDRFLAAKLEREQRADRYVEEIERRLRQWPASPARRASWRQDLLHALRRIAGDYLERDAEGLDRLFTTEAMEATRQFVREARAFAPAITDQSLFQALRNLWVTHSVQLFLRTPITLSPAIFAYSMLYPWTDNCLDDPRLDARGEAGFRRLAGPPSVGRKGGAAGPSFRAGRPPGRHDRTALPKGGVPRSLSQPAGHPSGANEKPRPAGRGADLGRAGAAEPQHRQRRRLRPDRCLPGARLVGR